jgi:hypothetical protein
MAGIFALLGAAVAYYTVRYPLFPSQYRDYSFSVTDTLPKLIGIAAVVLILSISTGLWLSHQKAKKNGLQLWSPASKQMVGNLIVPLITGGIFILIMLYTGHFQLAAPSCLIFYGIALIHGSANTFSEVRYLGYCEIALGLISALFPGYGLILWSIGFGILHIIYGAIMYNRYDK